MTPYRATSLASVFDQPASAGRSVLESARPGIGSITPEEATVRMRPQPSAFMPGRSRLVSVMIRSTMELK